MNNGLYLPNEQTLQFLRTHWSSDPSALALQAARYPDVDMPWVAQQVKGRAKAKEKIPTWYANEGMIYPPTLSMEQCSSEATARYKARLCSGTSLLDLTGGLGVDTAFMSGSFARTVSVERNETLAAIVKHNFGLLGLATVEVCTGDSLAYLHAPQEFDWLYLDPARRKASDQKAVLLTDCEPNILEHGKQLLKKAKQVLVKLSPLFDITELLRLFPNAVAVHIVSVDNECKELLLHLAREEHATPQLVCVNLLKDGSEQLFRFSFTDERSVGITTAPSPLRFLYEPNASIQKSGGFKCFAQAYGLHVLHVNSRLYTADEKVENFQGRRFEVEAVAGFSKPELKQLLGGTVKANITVRNFPMSVAELRKKLGLQDGGEVYLFATTLASGKKVLIRCRKDS